MKKVNCLIIATCMLICLLSCKKKSDPPPAKPEGQFIKTVTCTFPGSENIRSVSFEYDDSNTIKEITVEFGGLIMTGIYSYNEQGLIHHIDQVTTVKSSGVRYPNILKFNYVAGILNEFTSQETAYPVVYNAAVNSYAYQNVTFDLDESGRLKDLSGPVSSYVNVSYLSDKGIFYTPTSQIALHIHLYNYIRGSLGSYLPFIDVNAFSGSEIANIRIDGITYNLFAIRDSTGNIVQTDVKRASGELVFRYAYTYESRILHP
jgi:hypothetical protein